MCHLQTQPLTPHVLGAQSVSRGCSQLPTELEAGWAGLWPTLGIATILKSCLLPALYFSQWLMSAAERASEEFPTWQMGWGYGETQSLPAMTWKRGRARRNGTISP